MNPHIHFPAVLEASMPYLAIGCALFAFTMTMLFLTTGVSRGTAGFALKVLAAQYGAAMGLGAAIAGLAWWLFGSDPLAWFTWVAAPSAAALGVWGWRAVLDAELTPDRRPS